MKTPAEALDAVLEVVNDSLVRSEVNRLRNIEEWALGTLPLKAGDRAVLRKSFGEITDQTSGWWTWRECLRPGATGTVDDLFLGRNGWTAYFKPDTQWSVSRWADGLHRYPARDHVFMVRLNELRPERAKDRPLVMPTEGVYLP